MTYPAPPWKLKGFSLQTLHLLDIEPVRSFVPAGVNILAILPGKTLGGVYVAAYGAGSTLYYNELIVVSALVQAAGQWGAWISHIYVDHPDSVAGGREIWGLPKQMAEFTWNVDKALSVQVKQADQTLCTLSSGWQLPGWQQPLAAPVLSKLDQNLLRFTGQGTMKLQLADVQLTVPSNSPLSKLQLGHPSLGCYSESLDLTIAAPAAISG